MDNNTAIIFENVTKRYNLITNKLTNQPKLLALFKTRRMGKEEFLAINNVSFCIDKGEKVGILGQNGSGKSTLLKLISGVSVPNSGKIEINGNIGGLIELGAGFHPELTGRENIYVNGAILGLSEREIDEKLDYIVSFSEVDSFIDMPLKHYSSGMKVRLGFSIALVIENDILLLDEVLAVGDSKFRSKALQAMDQYMQGKTIVFISHDLNQIKKICTRCLVIDNGILKFDGDTESAISYYQDEVLNKKVDYYQSFLNSNKPSIKSAYLNKLLPDKIRDKITHGENIEIDVAINLGKLQNPKLGIRIRPKDSKVTDLVVIYSEYLLKFSEKVKFSINKIPLYDGIYEIDLILFENNQVKQIVNEGLIFKIEDTKLDYKLEGIIRLPYTVGISIDIECDEIFGIKNFDLQSRNLFIDINFAVLEIENVEELVIILSRNTNESIVRLSHFTVKRGNIEKYICKIDMSMLADGDYSLGYMLINGEKKLVKRVDHFCSFEIGCCDEHTEALFLIEGEFYTS
ncbi:ABC-type polysaccharide/polyol phosphate transport system ATPase subunit [Paenibacillus sp. LBL]|uniref:ABC transporter ATP-binding protein n=1 Tax=Paenibacillus sp. LBL TaxID=2940563 RepID=UPI0024768AE9|nr:ABC transporter ATP-binding protein [Paenibacillus sp. LBL]MDH6674550.1 ABC-type polysaccharide/polyol phosphate transport system ATPase subunit [Paenibacillus sp. LBL]